MTVRAMYDDLWVRDAGSDLRTISAAVWLCARDESWETQAALSHVIRNRGAYVGEPLDRACRAVLRDCGAVWRGAAPDPLSDRRFARLIVLLAGAASADPTFGAIRLHRHDVEPAWAAVLDPTELFGPWLTYRAPGVGAPRRAVA